MIWLRKRSDDELIYNGQSSIDYIRNEILPFSEYVQLVEKGDVPEADINWKSFQLVDAYLRCMIVYKWLVIPSTEGKISFFKSFSNPKELKEYVHFDCLIPSNQITNLPQNIQENLHNNFSEAINDFANEYKWVIELFNNDVCSSENKKLFYAKLCISFIIQGGLWTAILVYPKNINYLGQLNVNGNPTTIFDFVNTPIMQINKFHQFEKEIYDTVEFFKQLVKQSIEYYTILQKLYFKKLSKEDYLKLKCYFFEDCESDIKKQFIELLNDSNFVAIKNNCLEFQDYCYILLKTRILKYENGILQATKKDSWAAYYFGSFIHDKNLDLYNHISQINNFYRDLFDLHKKKDLDDVRTYSDTNTGYDKLSKETIIPKLNELKIDRSQK